MKQVSDSGEPRVNSLRSKLTQRSVLAGLTAVSILILTAGSLFLLHGQDSEQIATGVDSPVAGEGRLVTETSIHSGPEVPAHKEDRSIEVYEGVINRGQTLSRVLSRQGIGRATVHLITQEMAPVFDFRRAREGDRYRLERSSVGEMIRFRYTRSPLEHYRLEWDREGYKASRFEPEVLIRRTRVSGRVETNLYDAVSEVGADSSLAGDFAEIFAWDVDFSRSVRSGDEFAMVYRRLYVEEDNGREHYVGPGQILAARYTTHKAIYDAIYYEPEPGTGDYYRSDGTAVRRQFLKAPLQYRRISSRYSHSRFHPILKVRRPHHGIDYAAPVGTPVWSVGDGEVIFRGRSGGFGNLVKVRHTNGYVSYYGHLSRFARGVRVGTRVRQKQVVGFVGSTGLATGPHLDYRLRKNGKYLNPSDLRIPAGKPLSEAQQSTFGTVRDALLMELDSRQMISSAGAS